jgi:hypothetical protein
MEKNRGQKSRVRVLLTAFKDDLLVTTQSCEILYKAKLRGILRNSAEFRGIRPHSVTRNSV